MDDLPISLGIMYDFRNPPPFRREWTELYAELLDQVAWVDGCPAFQSVSLTEHHFADDGYLPSVLIAAAAIAARTDRLGILTNVLQLPLHHPVQVAEDALVVDALSAGRLRLGVGAGYREAEFAAYGTSTRDRRTRMEEGLDILRHAFAGEAFAYAGKHWVIPETTITPPPVRPGGVPIWIGGTVPAAIERAARRGDGFVAARNDQVIDYLAACERLGVPADRCRTCRTTWTVIHEDPERALADLGPQIVNYINAYIAYGAIQAPPFDDARDVVSAGVLDVLDAEGALAMLAEAHAAGVQEVHLLAVLPGEPVASGTERLQYVADHVATALRPAERF